MLPPLDNSILQQSRFRGSTVLAESVVGLDAKVGPQFNGLGMRGLERILEDVLDPPAIGPIDGPLRGKINVSVVATQGGRWRDNPGL